MNSTIRQALSGVGLVPAGQLQRLADESRQMSDKVKNLEDRVAKLRADAETWKRRHEEIAAKLREWKDVAAEADAERMRAGAEHAKARGSEWKARAEALTGEKLDLRARLEEAQRTAKTARDYLLSIR